MLTIEQLFNAVWQVEKLYWTLARFLTLIVLLTVGPVLLVLTGISASGYQLSLLLLADAEIVGLVPLELNHLYKLCLLTLFSSLFTRVPNAVVRPH